MEVIIRANDTLWYYSQLFDVPLLLIENSNPGVIPDQLAVGQTIHIPGYLLDTYMVKSGDTLWKIAIEKNIPVDSLHLVNPFVNQYSLEVGQTIYWPKRVNNYVVGDVDRYTYEKMLGDLYRLIEIYPFLRKNKIGRSVMGKELIEIKIGIGKKEVHLDGAFHANEWITAPIIMKFLNQYALSLTNNVPIRGIHMLSMYIDISLSLVPMVNPDGVNLVLNGATAAGDYRDKVLEMNNQNEDFSNWKANIKGVDLNNQFPARWEIEADRKAQTPQPRDYPGPFPLTEPESIAMADLAKTRSFARLIAFHTQGKVIYWGFEGMEPPISAVIAKEFGRVSNYEPVRYVDSYAGYKDWYIQEFRNPGFTIELGIGDNPLPIEQFPDIYQESLGVMLANLYL